MIYKIETTNTGYDWRATFPDSYDGAPDAGRNGIMGHGRTEADAIISLIEQVDDVTDLQNRGEE